jgi:hypothetical protein
MMLQAPSSWPPGRKIFQFGNSCRVSAGSDKPMFDVSGQKGRVHSRTSLLEDYQKVNKVPVDGACAVLSNRSLAIGVWI